MSRLLNLCAGLFLVSSLSGCCLLGHGGGYSPYGGGGYYGGGGGCSPCQTGVSAPGYPSAGLYNPAIQQSAFIPPAQISANMPQMGYPQQQQMVMTDTLSTF